MTPRRAIVAGALLAVIAADAVPAHASPSQDGGEPPGLVLVSQDYGVTPDDTWTAQYALADPDGSLAAAVTTSTTSTTSAPASGVTTGAGESSAPSPADVVSGEVEVRLHDRLDDRSQLAAVLDGQRGRIADGTTIDLAAALAPGPDGTATIRLDIPIDTAPGAGALTLARPGVYPLTVTVIIGGERTVSHRTFLRRLPTEPDTDPPLGIAITAALGDPGPDPSAEVLDEYRGALEALARYGATTSAPLSLALPPGLDAVLDGDELLRAEVADALDHTEVISLPLLTLDPSSAEAAGEMTRFANEVRQGEDTVARLFPGVAPRRSAWLVGDPLSGPAATALRDPLGYRLLVLDQATYNALPGSIGGYLDSQRLVAASPGPRQQDLAAAVVDPNSGLLEGDGAPPVDAAVELMTRLLVARQDIGPDDRRTAVLALDDFGLPDAATVDALATLVAGQPDVRLVTLSEVAARTDFMRIDDDITQVALPEEAGPELTDRLERIELVRVAAESAGSMLPTADRRNTWQRELDTMVSTGLTDAAVDATLDRIRAEVDGVLGSVEAPEPFDFTLTGRESSLRINVRNLADEPRLVLIRPSSAKLRFPGGEQVITLQPGLNEVVIPVEARTNGTSSVAIELLTPVFGAPLGPPTVLEARVNALTGLGQMVTGVAIVLLGSWWFSHYRRRRRQRLADQTPVDGIPIQEPLSPDAAEATAGPPSGRGDTASLTEL